MIVGAVDLIRQPGWAWRRAEESKTAYLILVLLLPLVGLGMYLYNADRRWPRSPPPGGRPACPSSGSVRTPTRSNGRTGRRAERSHRRSGSAAWEPSPSATGRPAWCSRPRRSSSRSPSRSAGPSSAPEEWPPGPSGRPRSGPDYRPRQRSSLRVHRGQTHGPRRLESRPHRPPPVPLLGRIPVDRERGRRRRADLDSVTLVGDRGRARRARGTSRLNRATSTSSTVSPGSRVAPESRSASARSWMARAIGSVPNRRDSASAFLAG